MHALTHEAHPTFYRDEAPPISPVLADPTVPEDPVILTERLVLYGADLWVITEDQGGGVESERKLGELTDVSDWDVPEHLRPEFYRLLGEEEDAAEGERGYRAEARRYY